MRICNQIIKMFVIFSLWGLFIHIYVMFFNFNIYFIFLSNSLNYGNFSTCICESVIKYKVLSFFDLGVYSFIFVI